MALDRPVIVTGTPRSGKTCVWNLLCQAAEFAGDQEPVMLWDGGVRASTDDRWGAALATEKVKHNIVKRCEERLLRSGKERYFDNLSYHALRIPFIYAIFPDVRLVHVVRDPKEVIPELLFGWTVKDTFVSAVRRRKKNVSIHSLPRMMWKFARNYANSRIFEARSSWGPSVPGLNEFRKNHTVAEICAFQWSSMNKIALEDIRSLPNLHALEVRYEELVSDPREQAKRIAEFAEVSEPNTLVEFAEGYLKEDYVHWEPCRKELTEADWSAVRSLIAPVQHELGYD